MFLPKNLISDQRNPNQTEFRNFFTLKFAENSNRK